MTGWAFLGGFAAVALAIALGVMAVRRKLRQLFGTTHLLSALAESEQAAQPRSLNGGDRFVIPQILRDFPDFDPTAAKTQARAYLLQQLADRPGVRVGKVVFVRYLPSAVHKTIEYQAQVSYQEADQTRQTRFGLHETYQIDTGDAAVAANCPNCAAALGYGVTTCPYCGSRVVNVMENTWKFTKLWED